MTPFKVLDLSDDCLAVYHELEQLVLNMWPSYVIFVSWSCQQGGMFCCEVANLSFLPVLLDRVVYRPSFWFSQCCQWRMFVGVCVLISKFPSRTLLGKWLHPLVSSQSSPPVHMELLQGRNSRNQGKTRMYVSAMHCPEVTKG